MLFVFVTVPWLMVYSPTVSPSTRVGVPVSVSSPTSAPVGVVKVRAGSESPYVLVLATAVTVIGLALMVSLAVVKVMS